MRIVSDMELITTGFTIQPAGTSILSLNRLIECIYRLDPDQRVKMQAELQDTVDNWLQIAILQDHIRKGTSNDRTEHK